MKVEDTQSEKFQVSAGLWQGCVLSTFEVVARLREEGCNVECGSDTIPGLLFADDKSCLHRTKQKLGTV